MGSMIRSRLNSTETLWRRLHHLSAPPSVTPLSLFTSCSGSGDPEATRWSDLHRVPSLVKGCDYEHWLVVMEAPQGYPPRNGIVRSYINTLAIALGSEEEAKRSMYSVSTKYYYAFGCRVPEILTSKIKSLPNVKWVLPDSYISEGTNEYGGEPFINGEVVPYDDRYHIDWVRNQNEENPKSKAGAKKRRKKRRKNSI